MTQVHVLLSIYGILWCIIVGCILLLLGSIIFADADLSLLWTAYFGKGTAKLRSKVIWITGASSGIGEALAVQLSSTACKLVLSARRMSELERVKMLCLEAGNIEEEDILILYMDMLDYESHERKTEEVIRYFGQVDVLINNAGRTQRGCIKDTILDVNKHIMDINYFSVVSLTKQVLPYMESRGTGHLALISSVSGKWGNIRLYYHINDLLSSLKAIGRHLHTACEPLCASYCASKFASQGWFESVRMEYPNIDVTIIVPGPVATNIGPAAFSTTLQAVGAKANESKDKMKVSRCAELSIVAIANKMPEVWISTQPYLFYTYITQYSPSLARWFGRNIIMKAAQKLQGTSKKEK